METLNFELLRIAVAVIGTGMAAYQDYRTSFIDDKLIYLMAGIGFVLNLVPFLLNNDFLILYALIVSMLVLAFGYLFYRRGQLGMGDVLLFVGIQQLLPLAPSSISDSFGFVRFEFPDISEFAPGNWVLIGYYNAVKHSMFFIGLFLASSLLATIGSSVQYALALLGARKKLRPNKYYAIASVLLFAISSYFIVALFGISLLSLAFLLLLLSAAFFLTFRQQILDEIVIQKISLKEIEDEDILALDRMPPQLVKKYGLRKVLTAEQVRKLAEIDRKEALHLFPVNKVLPRFGPYIFAALLLGIFFGDITSMILILSGR